MLGDVWVMYTPPKKSTSMIRKRSILSLGRCGLAKVLKNIFNNSENENAKAFLLSFSHFSIYSPKVFGDFARPHRPLLEKPAPHSPKAVFLGDVYIAHTSPIHRPSPPLK